MDNTLKDNTTISAAAARFIARLPLSKKILECFAGFRRFHSSKPEDRLFPNFDFGIRGCHVCKNSHRSGVRMLATCERDLISGLHAVHAVLVDVFEDSHTISVVRFPNPEDRVVTSSFALRFVTGNRGESIHRFFVPNLAERERKS